VTGRASGVKMMGMAEMWAPISLDGVAVHPGCWCVCQYYLNFAPENPEDGEMCLLVPAHPGCPRQSPESCKMVVCMCVFTHTFLLQNNSIETIGPMGQTTPTSHHSAFYRSDILPVAQPTASTN